MDWISNSKYSNLAIGNYIILALFGVLLRFMQLFPFPEGNYMFLLHAHSHFAFSGWMFFSLALLIAQSISSGNNSSEYRNVFIGSLVSAFGMLITFSIQGYNLLSIGFSTLFIFVTYRFAYLVFKGGRLRQKMNEIAFKLISGALILLCISSIGPFALAPLKASGFGNSPLYQDAIYFYLHFQMNGFMLLAALGLLASGFLTPDLNRNSRIWLYLFILSAAPLFFIFTLWADPPVWVWIMAFGGALLNLSSWLILCFHYKAEGANFTFLQKAAIVAITLKVGMQVIICIPAVGEWTFINRNLIIGYVHLLTLGCVMPLILDQFINRGLLIGGQLLRLLNSVFILTVITYLGLLFTQPLLSVFSWSIPAYQQLLMAVSLVFPVTGFLYYFRLKPASKTALREPAMLEAV